jgi:hypothetical protein
MVLVANMLSISLRRFPAPADDVRWKFCADEPDRVTVGQEVRVVVAYIEARPARMHENFVGLAYEAVRPAWPCPERGRRYRLPPQSDQEPDDLWPQSRAHPVCGSS